METNDDFEDMKPAAKPIPLQAREQRSNSISMDIPIDGRRDNEAVSAEIPFLITHWLAGYSNRPTTAEDREAVARVREATNQLAEAFSALGAFGPGKVSRAGLEDEREWSLTLFPSGTWSPLQLAPGNGNLASRTPNTYAAMKRTWAYPHDHLETVLEASKGTTTEIDTSVKQPINYFQQCTEQKRPTTGRTLNEAIAIDTASDEVSHISSVIQKPAVFSLNANLQIDSALGQQQGVASNAMRVFLNAREDVKSLQSKVRMHERSIDYNRQLVLSLDGEEAASSERVVSQLQQKLPSLQQKLSSESLPRLIQTRKQAHDDYLREKKLAIHFRHPVVHRPDYRNNTVLRSLLGRSFTGQRAVNSVCKSLVTHRFSHVVTINTHLNYPVYCLKFDTTGRYFVTGADDFLVKVFQIVDIGAVLVCTLKGHAGVINDIEISSDNGFLATASEDGDVRVWGLRDGCPVAVLRGHIGGANMVSWSTLVPYQLVTTGADGLARIWDIRKACLKRYSQWIGSRSEYTHKVDGKLVEEAESSKVLDRTGAETPVLVPPLLAQQEDNNVVPGIAPQPQLAPIAAPGQFVSNSLVDEGVNIIAKLQHGAQVDEQAPGTRANQTTVKVICVARCPHGGHFATGSDDGICRVWEDDFSSVVKRIDREKSSPRGNFSKKPPEENVLPRRRNGNQPAFTLQGHLSAVTDLAYSKCGNRLLSASQKDGAVRLWSWEFDPSHLTQPAQPMARAVTSITINLTKPSSNEERTQQGPRQRRNRNQVLVSCDAACWLNDDSKIITAQCEYTKENASAIIPGSQYIFLWDSSTGNCLLGVAAAHKMQCPVVLPHPVLSSVFCSAGADGYVKLWNWESGECLFSHKNVATVGPVDPNERGKTVGFLDGHFSRDGCSLVLSDDGGRVSVFDSSARNLSSNVPEWVKEQYFSNDYYDLFYDENGYCIERGSEMPPHLSPKGSRCTHSGVAFAPHMHDRFRRLMGPIPNGEHECRWTREVIRQRAESVREATLKKRANRTGGFDANTVTIFNQDSMKLDVSTRSHVPETTDTGARSARQLSSNWRWRDYDDIEREIGNDDAEPDSDDEEFDPSENRAAIRVPNNPDGSDSEDNLDAVDFEGTDPQSPPARGPRNSNGQVGLSDDDEDSTGEFVEYMSTNNRPSGPFVADYDYHMFKLRSRSQANQLHREWVRRNESTSSYEGRKTYTPQLGDSVVYIPRVHYEAVKDFPGLEAPWMDWPVDKSWPVVKCCIRNIRYRFPFHRPPDVCRSVVSKITVELTGVPQPTQQRVFPWPSTIFVAPDSKMVFENDASEFVIPSGLFEQRMNELEAAVGDNGTSEIAVEAFFSEDSGGLEDSVLVAYTGTFIGHKEESTDDALFTHGHLSGSGYRCAQLRWEGDRRVDEASPWELSVTRPELLNDRPELPRLSEEDKRSAREALRDIRSMPDVSEYFGQPVGEAYSDYNCRVEVPIDLSFISSRLEAGYYSNLLSVVADVRLILTNCVKYNGQDDSLTIAGQEMLSTFESRVLDQVGIQMLHEYDGPCPGSQSRIPNAELRGAEGVEPSESSSMNRRRLRAAESVSVLESIPQPGSDVVRRSRRVVRPPRNFEEETGGRRRSARSRLRRAQGSASIDSPVRTLEQLSSSRQRTRGRSSGRRGRTVVGQSNTPLTRRNAVAGDNRRSVYERLSSRPGLRNSAAPSFNVESPTRDDFSELNSSQSNPNEGGGFTVATRSRVRAENSNDDRSEGNPITRQRTTRIRISMRQNGPGNVTNPRMGVSTRQQTQEPTSESGTTRTSSQLPELPEALSPESSSEDEEPPTPKSNGSRRSANQNGSTSNRRSTRKRDTAPVKSEDDEESDAKGISQSKKRRSRASSDEESSFDESKSEEDEGSDVEPPVLSSDEDLASSKVRKSKRKKRPLSLSDDESNQAPRPRSRRTRATIPKDDVYVPLPKKPRKQATQRAKPTEEPSRRSRAPTSYADPSSSEFDDESEGGPTPRKAITTKRKGRTATVAARKRTVNPKKRKQFIDNWMHEFELTVWPEISLGHISKVTEEVVGRFQELDEMKLFAVPVVSKHPLLADDYLAQIHYPMDFRTIMEERIHSYQSIRELQEDLVLVFANCMEFNEDNTMFHDSARTMMEMLEETFEGVCNDLAVRPLRHR